MGERYLIDTNTIIDFSENKLHSGAKEFVALAIDNDPFLSVINKIELLGFSNVSDNIIELVGTSTVIGLTDPVIATTINIQKSRKIKLPDAIIAATAIQHDLILVTRNVADFNNIDGLRIADPWER